MGYAGGGAGGVPGPADAAAYPTVVGIIVLLAFFQYVVAFHLVILFGVDLGLMMEVCAAAFILVARKNAGQLLRTARQGLHAVTQRATLVWRHGMGRARRSRAIRVLKPPRSTDDDGLTGAFGL